jgi:hypothetical protein
MPDNKFPHRPLTMLEVAFVGKVAAGIVIALLLIAFAIFCSIFGWP